MDLSKKILTAVLALCMLFSAFALAACDVAGSESSAPAEDLSESESSADESSGGDESMEESTPDTGYVSPIDEIESYPMTLEMMSDTMFRMTCTDELGKPFILTFTKKSWGPWNLCDWIYIGNSITGGSTDWEYVYRAGSDASGWVWSGGNHKNEKFLSIEFFDGITGEKLELEKGDKAELEKIKIVENTQLHLGDESVTYCDVVRTYNIVGRQVTLDVNYDFTADTYFWLSYTCMFPVNKKYGLYIDFKNDDGTTKTVETSEVGKADYTGPMYKGNAASLCEIYGKTNPEYRFFVEVFTTEDSVENFKNTHKTFYWDMNTTHNKLYFSKFEESSPTKVTAGTQWHTTCRWTFVPDYEVDAEG